MRRPRPTVNFSIPGESAGGVRRFLMQLRRRWWFRVLAILALLFGLTIAAMWMIFARDLPSVEALRTYEPALPTNVRGDDGSPIHSYARERRVELSYAEYPQTLVHAFLAAEDRTFFEHHGIDYPGIASALWDNLTSDRRARGASTITQQVAKNLLTGNEHSIGRKVREAILAYRIENVLTKPQILELYLNQIALGRNAFGVEAAAQAYFGRDLNQLDLAQSAYLAILPKGPSNYDPVRHLDRAMERRSYVLNEMLRSGWITQAEHDQAQSEPINAITRQTPRTEVTGGGYFIEEVRRQLIQRFGEDQRAGPYSVYSGGLWVRTSLDPRIQGYAQQALRDGLLRFERGRGWAGPLRHVDIADLNWQAALLNTNIALDYSDWHAAIVISKDAGGLRLGFADGSTGTMSPGQASMPARAGGTAFNAIQAGDVLAVAPEGGSFGLRSVPSISGGFVAEEPATGRVLAMQGGFDSTVQAFNRATQAMRQPGSTIKPIVYAAALANGMTPTTIVQDAPYCVSQGRTRKCFVNFGGGQGSGPHTMRWGLEQSRNLMTVRLAAQTGMPHVVDLISRMGIGNYPPYLSFSLGAGETTVSRMVNAYTILANHGRAHQPTLIDFVQDRHGRVIWPLNWAPCDHCNAPDWNGRPMPRPQIRGRQVLDPLSAYQMVHIAEGVIQRGTATILHQLNRPMFGKTGTNSGPRDVWFIGGTPQMIGGVYIGYDTPRPLGGYAQGGTIAAPIFLQFARQAYEGLPPIPFRAPEGIRMVRIDRASGRPVLGAWPTTDPRSAVIWEAFKPETEGHHGPIRRDQAAPVIAAPTRRATTTSDAPRDTDFLQRQGGIY